MATMRAQHLLNQHVMGMSCMAMSAAFPSTVVEAAEASMVALHLLFCKCSASMVAILLLSQLCQHGG